MNDTLNPTISFEELRQHELIILRRLRQGPLTEFELTAEVAEATAYTHDQVTEQIGEWLEGLMAQGYVWSGTLSNNTDQTICAAALTRKGRKLVE